MNEIPLINTKIRDGIVPNIIPLLEGLVFVNNLISQRVKNKMPSPKVKPLKRGNLANEKSLFTIDNVFLFKEMFL